MLGCNPQTIVIYKLTVRVPIQKIHFENSRAARYQVLAADNSLSGVIVHAIPLGKRPGSALVGTSTKHNAPVPLLIRL